LLAIVRSVASLKPRNAAVVWCLFSGPATSSIAPPLAPLIEFETGAVLSADPLRQQRFLR